MVGVIFTRRVCPDSYLGRPASHGPDAGLHAGLLLAEQVCRAESESQHIAEGPALDRRLVAR